MPTSTYSHIPTVILYLQKIMPSSILDVGCGNGKMGFIARDFLDVMLGQRYKSEEWKVLIDGIEIFPDYIQDHQKSIYDNIYIGDAFEIIDSLKKYDLIILGDVLEHFEKQRAWEFLDKCAEHSNTYIILNIPLGEKWTQEAIYGNPYERHLSFWNYQDFEPFVTEKDLFPFPSLGEYGCLLIRKDDYLHCNIRRRADELYMQGKHHESIEFLETSLAELHPNMVSEFLLVDMLLKDYRIKEAIQRLELTSNVFPEDKTIEKYLEKLKDIESHINFRDTHLETQIL